MLDLSTLDRLHVRTSLVQWPGGKWACLRCSRARLILLVHRWEDSVCVVFLLQYRTVSQRGKGTHWPSSREHAIGRVNVDSSSGTRVIWLCRLDQLVFDRHLKAAVGRSVRSTVNFEHEQEERVREHFPLRRIRCLSSTHSYCKRPG